MKNLTTVTVRRIKVQLNSSNTQADQWARIKDADTGQILHTGRVGYIRRVAKKKYNKSIAV